MSLCTTPPPHYQGVRGMCGKTIITYTTAPLLSVFIIAVHTYSTITKQKEQLQSVNSMMRISTMQKDTTSLFHRCQTPSMERMKKNNHSLGIVCSNSYNSKKGYPYTNELHYFLRNEYCIMLVALHAVSSDWLWLKHHHSVKIRSLILADQFIIKFYEYMGMRGLKSYSVPTSAVFKSAVNIQK